MYRNYWHPSTGSGALLVAVAIAGAVYVLVSRRRTNKSKTQG